MIAALLLALPAAPLLAPPQDPPAAEAPMATLMAANSDSTLTNSQAPSRPARTISLKASTMWVWGVIG